MLRFFRVNDPYRLLGVFFVMVLASALLFIDQSPITIQELKNRVLGETLNDGKSMYAQVIDNTPWLAAEFARWTEFIFGRSMTGRHILAVVVLFFQAAFFSLILVRNKAYTENNYFPALVFGVLCFFSFDLISLTDELWASTFLLFALNNLFKEIEFKIQRDETILNLGVYIGIASLFVLNYSIFLLGVYVILLSFTRIDLRKSSLLLFGFLFPHVLLGLFYYFKDGLSALSHFYYANNLPIAFTGLIPWTSLFLLGLPMLFYFFFSMVMLSREARFTRYQSQLLQVMFIWLFIAAVTACLSRERTPHSFIIFIPSMAYFISHYLLLIRRKRIAELMLWLLISSVIGINFAARRNKMEGVDYSKMFVKDTDQKIGGKRILVLSNEIELYQNNKMASVFLNWELSKPIFELGRYYTDLVLISKSFQNDPPEIIVDEQNQMEKIFARLPQIKKRYQRNGNLYELKK